MSRDLSVTEINFGTPSARIQAEERASFNATDSGNAELFTSLYGDDVRYDHRQRRWLVWQRHRWVPDADAEIQRRAKAAMRQRHRDAESLHDLGERTKIAKWAIQSESRARLESLLFLAQAEIPITDKGDTWDIHPWLFGVPNGIIDLRTGTLRNGAREDKITMATTTIYNPAAKCPRWEQFIKEVFVDPDLMAFVHRAVGYSLTGDTSEQCLFLCHGSGSNGKGTFTNTLKALLGDYGHVMPFACIEATRQQGISNDVAALMGRRFVCASETSDGSRFNEARIKGLTGGDPISARFLFQESFTFQPMLKLWLSVNHLPVVRDDSHGFWRRMRLIPFTRTFTVDPALADTLKNEAQGILAWAVRGCLDWQRERLNPPSVVAEATREYEQDSDPLEGFLREACERDQAAEIMGAELYQQYGLWAKNRHQRA